VVLAALAGGCHFGAYSSPVTPVMGHDPSWKVVPAVPMARQQGKSDCGVAALEMVIRYWQPDASPAELRAALGPVVDDKGLEASKLRAVARDHGLDAFIVEGTPDDLFHEVGAGRPVIVGLVRKSGRRVYSHYEVVVGVNERRRMLLAADPQDGWQEVELEDFLRQWDPAHRFTMVMLPKTK
jgi:ABC-type bacteriocin/lantibiotic exporter with double-glycine peptidase domain